MPSPLPMSQRMCAPFLQTHYSFPAALSGAMGIITPPLPCVLAIASTEYLQSIHCLLNYSLWIKAQYFLASLHFLHCLLLTVTYLPFLPRLLIDLNSFCLWDGLPFLSQLVKGLEHKGDEEWLRELGGSAWADRS